MTISCAADFNRAMSEIAGFGIGAQFIDPTVDEILMVSDLLADCLVYRSAKQRGVIEIPIIDYPKPMSAKIIAINAYRSKLKLGSGANV